jgi:hypothetical protein
MRDVLRRLAPGLVLVLLLVGCGEPPVALEVPERSAGAHLLDTAGLLGATTEDRLREVSASTGLDVVGLTFEDERATLGQADRGGKRLLSEWDADVVLVAVGRPGDFVSEDAERSRYFGVFAGDRFTVSRDVRERIIYERVQLLAAENAWAPAFAAAIDELEAELLGLVE